MLIYRNTSKKSLFFWISSEKQFLVIATWRYISLVTSLDMGDAVKYARMHQVASLGSLRIGNLAPQRYDMSGKWVWW